jgi:hypothetical protein
MPVEDGRLAFLRRRNRADEGCSIERKHHGRCLSRGAGALAACSADLNELTGNLWSRRDLENGAKHRRAVGVK